MELTEIKDTGFEEYEALLLHRDVLRKDAAQYQLAWIREFGELFNDVFAKKIECIEKKKKIAWCQARINRNLPLDENELNSYITNVMVTYYDELNERIRDVKNVRSGRTVSASDIRKIKEIYRELAKKIHPDRRPDLAEDETIRQYWNDIVNAYTYNRLEELEELKFRVESYLASIDQDEYEPVIDDLCERIAKVQKEIDTILSTNPYQYKFILDDEDAMNEQKTRLEDELQSYTEYSIQLDEVLKQFVFVQRRPS